MKTTWIFCIIFLLTSCSSKIEKKRTMEEQLRDFSVDMFPNYKATWFDTEDPLYRVEDREARIQKHLFYDPDPTIDESDNSLNFIATTNVDSASYYDLDLVSGMTYRVYNFCPQLDVWQSYSKPVIYPPYTEGFVPRVLDKLGRPQKVLVFGSEDYYAGRLNFNTRKVKVIGGLVEQYCQLGHCTGSNSWQTHMVLLAVDESDNKLSKVETISQLKKLVDWEYAKAFRENGAGRNIVGANDYPAFRIAGEVRAKAALNYVKNQTKKFSHDDLMSMRKSCHSLYDFIWENIGELHLKKNLKLSKKTIQKMKKKIDELKKDFTKNKKEYVKHKRYDFTHNFISILENFRGQYQTCTDYVKPSNVNLGFERHWFFSYFTAVMKLYQMGQYYSCQNQAWYPNPLDIKGNLVNDPIKKLENCTSRQLNQAFNYAIAQLASLKLSGTRFYRFIDYDNGAGGTHNKLYSWVSVQAQKLKCDENLLDKLKVKENRMENADFIFPNDIKWAEIE